MTRQRIVVLGGRGSGAIVAEAIKTAATSGAAIDFLGFLNDAVPKGSALIGAPVLGRFEDWKKCAPDTVFIGAIPKPKEAQARFQRLLSLDIPPERWATVSHPRAVVADNARLRGGSYIGPLTIVEAGVVAGEHACLRGGYYISHDVSLERYVFVGPNATILGRCRLGEGCHVGANAVCREERSIGRYAVLGIGAVVTDDVPDFAVVAGNPAKTIGTTRPTG